MRVTVKFNEASKLYDVKSGEHTLDSKFTMCEAITLADTLNCERSKSYDSRTKRTLG